MSIFATIKTALKAMSSNKVRTGLTVLGMVIGIASVIVVFSAGEGIRGLILSQVESFGTDIVETEVKIPSTKKDTAGETQSAQAIAQGVQVTTLKIKDMEDVLELPNVVNGYAAILSQEQVSYGAELKKAFLLGVTAGYIEVDKTEIDYGRFFTDAEDKSLSQVVVLGPKIKDKLFGDSDPIGASIKIHKSKYRVIGVMKERGAVMTMNFDDYVYVPLRTLQKREMGIEHVFYMIHQLADLSLAEDTAEQIRLLIRENHDISDPDKDDFRVMTMQEMMSMLDTITNAITLLLLAIVAISLIVGGVGITNIMYVIVSERTKEIGLRKAVGANYSNIMWQFLIEAVIITLAGGVVGVIIGVIFSYLISLGANAYGLDWRFSIPIRSYLIALGFSGFFGIVFGVYPARKAARLEPVEALRKE